jgi:hypothetical protein
LRPSPPSAIGSDDPDGCEIVVNSTPCGIRPGDALPIRADRLADFLLGASPLGASPLGASPLGASPLGASPLGASPLGAS